LGRRPGPDHFLPERVVGENARGHAGHIQPGRDAGHVSTPMARARAALFVGGNLVPFQMMMVPVRDLMIAVHLYDTRWALVVFHTAFQTGFSALFIWNFIRELPDAVLDAARLEGAGELRIFRSVVLPLVRPALASVGVLIFTFVWNDYFWLLVLVQSDTIRR
jgi:multiple sugar transport system permease protein